MYRPRIADDLLALKLEAFGATLITGPKGCGKTTTAKQCAKSVVEFQDEEKREALLEVAKTAPSKLLEGEKPRLLDEWQDAPKIWGAVRKSVDDTQGRGLYILTGSSATSVDVPHTGTLRISRLEMEPMSLFESGESSGEVSLSSLFSDPESFDFCESPIDIDGLIFAICRGGWPQGVENRTRQAQLAVAKDLYTQTYSVDISKIDGTPRNPAVARDILRSYSRNVCTLAESKTIQADVLATHAISKSTIYDYLAALEKLFIIKDVEAWCPAIRSRSAIRASKKRNLVDPSIAVAALGISPEYFNEDFKTLGFLFECLCLRDLRVYSKALGGYTAYYRDRYGLEADCVLHLEDGRYALVEFKLGQNDVDEGAKHLLEIERLVIEHNMKEEQVPLRLPDLKIVITATKYGYRTDDGVIVLPITCLRD